MRSPKTKLGLNGNLCATVPIPQLSSRTTVKQLTSVLLTIAFAVPVLAQTVSGLRTDQYRRAHEREIIAEFVRLLEIANVASDSQNIRRNAELIREMMQKRGLRPRLLETASKSS